AVWDVANGLRLPANPNAKTDASAGDPLAALKALPALADKDGTALLLMHNLHRFLNNPEVIQTAFSQHRTHSGSRQSAFGKQPALHGRLPRVTAGNVPGEAARPGAGSRLPRKRRN